MRKFLAVLLASVWISISEFVRNEFLLKSYWLDHYGALGVVFPSAPINGAVWGLWSLCLAIAIYFVSRKFSLRPAALLSWFFAFVMMWLVAGNLGVLPATILPFAIPLSLLESYVACWIVLRVAPAA
ncbi:MAG: hypothetical protein K1X75_13440 [Leptospirales bacterium]|nr:hypothetical protein [Leptospirales bacterium]